jgi:hypothetical protein
MANRGARLPYRIEEFGVAGGSPTTKEINLVVGMNPSSAV